MTQEQDSETPLTESEEQTDSPETTAEPQYVTREQYDQLANQIEEMTNRLEQSETPDPTDRSAIDEYYSQIDSGLGEATEDDPQEKQIKELRAQVTRMEQLMVEQAKSAKRAEIDAEFGKKYSDWKDYRDDIWKTAAKHPTLGGDEVYALVKSLKGGTKAESKSEHTEEVKHRAERAASERPSSGGATAVREAKSLGDVLKQTWNKLPNAPSAD